ncbi:hypothetical protein E3J38_01175 [candidate division TA06 bacterium]|uniref:DUF3108 domain-containing protein n=1 Tax=candidate division TA06 bacterium TaxID=2250710 RepID=A0A523XUT6_UNCT6|nr:MAG: hypothetical protein E3J38_01175 [candidate division TA06 bacterium]
MRKHALLAFIPFLIVLSASAQIPTTRMPYMPTEFKMPSVGSWSQYWSINTEEGDTVVFKYSLTGKEKCGKTGCYWYEFQTTEGKQTNMVKMLVSGDPDEPGHLKRLIIKSGDEPAVELPVGTTHGAGTPPSRVRESNEAEVVSEEENLFTVGKETITTPAGKIKCTHLRIKKQEGQTDLWTNEAIPFFGIAKLVQAGMTMEITGYGESGAKTAISEEPEKMPKPGIGR